MAGAVDGRHDGALAAPRADGTALKELAPGLAPFGRTVQRHALGVVLLALAWQRRHAGANAQLAEGVADLEAAARSCRTVRVDQPLGHLVLGG